jgi:hypothetical protein
VHVRKVGNYLLPRRFYSKLFATAVVHGAVDRALKELSDDPAGIDITLKEMLADGVEYEAFNRALC